MYASLRILDPIGNRALCSGARPRRPPSARDTGSGVVVFEATMSDGSLSCSIARPRAGRRPRSARNGTPNHKQAMVTDRNRTEFGKRTARVTGQLRATTDPLRSPPPIVKLGVRESLNIVLRREGSGAVKGVAQEHQSERVAIPLYAPPVMA